MNMYKNPRMVLILSLTCAFLWGSAYPCVKLCYQLFGLGNEIPSRILLAAARFALAGGAMLIYCRARGESLRITSARTGRYVAMLAVFQTVIQYSLYYVGLMNMPAASASVLNQSSNFFLVLATPLFFSNDRLTPRKLLGVGLGLAGMVVMNLGDGFSVQFSFMGEGLVLLSAIAAVAGYIICKKAAGTELSACALTGWQQFIGGVILLAVGGVTGGRLETWTVGGTVTLVYLAAIACVAYSIWMRLLQNNEVARVTVYKFMVPIFGVLCSAVLLGESVFSWQTMIALIMVAAGIIIISIGKPQKA